MEKEEGRVKWLTQSSRSSQRGGKSSRGGAAARGGKNMKHMNGMNAGWRVGGGVKNGKNAGEGVRLGGMGAKDGGKESWRAGWLLGRQDVEGRRSDDDDDKGEWRAGWEVLKNRRSREERAGVEGRFKVPLAEGRAG